MIKKLALLTMTFGLVATSYAADVATDNAADPVYDPATAGGWNTGDNGGSGFGPWALSAPGSTGSTGGFFIDTSTANGAAGSGGIDTAGRSFGIYANSGIVATANRSFSGTTSGSSLLQPGQTFSLQMDNGFVANNSAIGFNLQAADGTTRFTFQFIGGTASNPNGTYSYNVGNANEVFTTVQFTTNGLTLSFFQDVNNAFQFTIAPIGGTAEVIQGTLAASDISQFQLFNNNAGSGSTNNLYFNNMAVVPEPSSLSLLAGPAILGAWFFVRRRRA